MPTFTSIVRIVVFLAISKLCQTSSHDPSWKPAGYRRKNALDRIDVFNDVGIIDIEVPGKHYVLNGSQIYVEGPYSDSDLHLTPLTQIDVQTIVSLNNSAEFTTPRTVWNISLEDSDDGEDYLSTLYVLSLETSRLHNLNSSTFRWLSSTSIQFLNMRHTDIEIVAEDTLEPVQSTLQVLDLTYATISLTDLTALMQGLRNDTTEGLGSALIVLSLANLGLNSIPWEALSRVQYSIRGLSLFGNNLQAAFADTTDTQRLADYEENEVDSTEELPTNYFSDLLQRSSAWPGFAITESIFPVMPFLLVLDLRSCNIDSIDRGSFQNLENLRRLYLSGNNILILRNLAFDGLMNLVRLDISVNGHTRNDSYSRGLILCSQSFAGMGSLTTVDLSNTAIRSSTVRHLIGLPQSLTALNLSQTRLVGLRSGIFEGLSNLNILDLSNNFKLTSELTTETFNGLDMIQELYLVKTSLSSLVVLGELSSLRVLDVRRNNIQSFEGMLEKFPLLEYLDVSSNYISSWRDERVFASNTKLQTVNLESNMLSWMSEVMLEDFKSLTYLTLADNSFVCNCQLKYFMEYLIDLNGNTVQDLPILSDYQENGTSHICLDATLSKTFAFADTDNYCITDRTRYWLSALQHTIYISLLVVVCSVSIGGLVYWKWWYIRYVAILIKNATLLSIINVENCEDRIYTYDIFVSYSDRNRNWVIEELIPNIEGPEAKFNICMHERDFQVGVSILENIIIGMDQSRTILLIISGCFLKSQWCQFEMHLAQHRLLETCREELVLVLLEEIPRRNRPKTLQYLMMIKTYIVWPQDNNDSTAKQLFWKRLRRAITANKSRHTTVV